MNDDTSFGNTVGRARRSKVVVGCGLSGAERNAMEVAIAIKEVAPAQMSHAQTRDAAFKFASKVCSYATSLTLCFFRRFVED